MVNAKQAVLNTIRASKGSTTQTDIEELNRKLLIRQKKLAKNTLFYKSK